MLNKSGSEIKNTFEYQDYMKWSTFWRPKFQIVNIYWNIYITKYFQKIIEEEFCEIIIPTSFLKSVVILRIIINNK